jgi:hypothetical protein
LTSIKFTGILSKTPIILYDDRRYLGIVFLVTFLAHEMEALMLSHRYICLSLLVITFFISNKVSAMEKAAGTAASLALAAAGAKVAATSGAIAAISAKVATCAGLATAVGAKIVAIGGTVAAAGAKIAVIGGAVAALPAATAVAVGTCGIVVVGGTGYCIYNAYTSLTKPTVAVLATNAQAVAVKIATNEKLQQDIAHCVQQIQELVTSNKQLAECCAQAVKTERSPLRTALLNKIPKELRTKFSRGLRTAMETIKTNITFVWQITLKEHPGPTAIVIAIPVVYIIYRKYGKGIRAKFLSTFTTTKGSLEKSHAIVDTHKAEDMEIVIVSI